MKILAVESATTVAAVAVLDGEDVRGEIWFDVPRSHSENLLPYIDMVLSRTGTGRGDLGLLAVSLGPGSFTGLRIGLATVQGLALGLGIPLRGVGTLEGLSENLRDSGRARVCLIHARETEAYGALYSAGGAQLEPPAVWTPGEVVRVCRAHGIGDPLLVGDGARMLAPTIREGLPEARLAGAPACKPRAASVGMAALRAYRSEGPHDPAALLPLYVRESQARQRQGGADG